MGGTTLGPEEALRFARGEEVVSTSGQPVRLSRPLDWIAVTDHSDGMGTIAMIRDGNAEMMTDPTLKRWHDLMAEGGADAQTAMMELIAAQTQKKLPKLIMDPRFAKTVGRHNNDFAEKYNEPGRFTALIGYEWTSNAGGGDNLHRNVIYRDGKAQADQVLPMTTFVSENPEDLWAWMANWEKQTGGRLLAIPHNGNLSNGRMFELQTFNGGPLTKEWAEQRAKWEPLFEAIQYKGQSEAHPSLSPTDEFTAGYELWDRGNLTLVPKQPGMIAHEYLREALKNGLLLDQQLGANAFKYGMAAGTDTHNALVAAEEDNFYGKFASSEPSAGRADENAMKFGDRVVKGWELTAAGYTAVWATENTREAIWDAMKRKETYATTGPRMWLRFFGGYDFVAADITARAGHCWIQEGRTDGWRPAEGHRRQGADVPRRRGPRSLRRQPRSRAGHQGLGGQGRQDARKDLRRRLEQPGAAQGRRRQADAGRQHRRRRHGFLDQHDRHARVDRRVEGSGVRSCRCALSTTRECWRFRRRAGRRTTRRTSR